jgi:hypothetical protein
MAAVPEKLAALRHLLAERYPAAARPSGHVLRTGLPSLDDPAGGLPLSAVTEIVCATPSCGSQLLLGQLLATTRAIRIRVALIDSADTFDPASVPADLLAHLVWVRCPSAPGPSAKMSPATTTALHSADLLARDANLGLVVLDLRRAPESDLRRIPGPQWYRLQRAVEPADLALVVLTPRAAVPSAQLRFTLDTAHAAAALTGDRPGLAARLAPRLQRQRLPASLAG